MKRYAYTYQPLVDTCMGALDVTDPNVIKGRAISTGAQVRIARELNPPMYPTKVFCMIEDRKGNVQSVYRRAVVKGGQ